MLADFGPKRYVAQRNNSRNMKVKQQDSPAQTAQVIVVSLNPTLDFVLEVEDFQVGLHQLGRQLQRAPAGKGLNVSRTLNTLGVSSIITGFVGQESLAEFEQALQDTRITGEFFAVPGHTQQNVTVIDPSRGTNTHIRQQGLKVTKQDLERMSNKLSLLAEKGKLVVFSGSLPLGLTSADLLRLLHICSQAGARTVVDSSPLALAAAVGEGLWLIKPNREEFAKLTSQADQSLQQMVHSAGELTNRVENVLISLAEQGAMLVNRQLAIRAYIDSSEPMAVLSTVGSGDSLLGAFLAGIVQGQDVQDCLSLAVAVSWAACQTSAPASFEMDIVEQVRAKVRMEQLGGL